MAKIRFENGTVVNFEGNPTPQDVEEVAQKIGISKPTQPELEKETPWIEGNRVVGDERFGQLVGKGFSNIIPSTARMAKGLLYDLPKTAIEVGGSLIKDPIGTISKIPAMGSAVLEQTGIAPQARAREKAFKDILGGKNIKDVLFDPQFLEAETAPLTNLAKMGIEDPVGTALLAEGAIQNIPILKKGVEKAGKLVEAGIKAPFKGAGKLAEVATAQATGLEGKTLKTISQYPEEFKLGQKGITREKMSENVFGKLSKRLDELKDTGREYGAIRKQTDIVDIPEGFFEKELSKLGLSVEKGKVVRSPSSPPISAGDAKKLEDFLQVYGKSKTMNPAEFLNTRQFLSDLSEFGVDKTDHLNMIARQIRNNFNEIGQDKITNLTKLDAKFADEMNDLSKVKRDYFNFDGTLKDGAINKLSNLTGKGKDRVLERLENVIPDVRKQIDIVKAFEDMEAVKSQKVGTYVRAGLGVGGLATGNPIMLAIGALGLSPELSAQLIKYSQQGAKGVGQFFDDLNNLRIKKILPKPQTLKLRKGSFTPFEDINPKQANPAVGEVGDLTQEAGKYSYRSSHQIRDAVGIDTVDLPSLKEQVRELDGYISNEKLKDFNKLQKLQSNPDAEVKIYRASPINEINPGDWVTTNKDYANNIKQQNGGKVYEYTVKVSDLNLPKNIGDNPSGARFSAFQYNQKSIKIGTEQSLLQEARKYKSAEEFVKAQGNPLLHGTEKQFKEFDITKRGMNEKDIPARESFFFTDSLDTAKSYGKNIQERYGNFKKPLTLDADGKMYGDMREELREAVLKAKKEGNDVVIIKNLSDRKDWGNYEPATHYAVLDTNSLKTKSQLTDIWNKANSLKKSGKLIKR